ncbi:AraC family transcriptional regulator [Mucilaginibacter gynuensis]|uniref:AraC family transcriptional regulator n=1 Tax=Mucilaginibacter gynuensis TaxID=1302236 RepID=A0ABP8GHP5_9SPHI
MTNVLFKRRDGFEGQKLINVPEKVWDDVFKKDASFFQLYITQIGYFPKARFHYRERRKGCEDNILIYCVQGKGHYVLDGQYHTVVANQFIILPATDKPMRYWADIDDPWTIYWVHFTGSNINGFNIFLNIDETQGPVQISFNAKAIDIWHSMFQSLEEGYTIENLCDANFCLYSFIATFLFPTRHVAQPKPESTDIVTETINHMRANLDKRFTVEDMAKKHNFSRSYFSNIFRKATGMPPVDYFIHLKMQKACQLLYEGETKIKTIALDVGYDDPFYFSRIFKKYMGISPEQYRLSTQYGVLKTG